MPSARAWSFRLLWGWVAFGVLYFGASSLGLALSDERLLAVPVWPAAGLSLAVLLRFGWRWTVLPLAVFAFVEAFLHNERWPTALGAGVGNVLGPLLGAMLAKRFAGGKNFGESPAHLFRFAALGAGGNALVSATLGTLGGILGGEPAGVSPWTEWFLWGVSDVVGALLFTPPLLAWSRGGWTWRGQTAQRWLEAVALALACVVGAQFAFGSWPFGASRYPLEYATIPLLIWAAFRFSGRGVATAAAGLGSLAIFNTLSGHGPFATPGGLGNTAALIDLQVFLGCTTLMALGTAAVVREQRTQALALEDTVAQRTGEIRASNEQLRTELTERRRAEEALRESRTMLRLVIDMIPLAVWWKDRNSVYLGCNRFMANAAGLTSPEDIVGRTDYDLPWKREQAEQFRAVDARVMGEGRPEFRLPERQLQADGTEAWLETSKVPLHDAEGRVVGVLGTYEDITTRRRMDQELRTAHDKLEARVGARTVELAHANEDLRREVAERIQAAGALRENEHRLRLALEAGQMSAWRIEPAANRFTWFHFKGEAQHLAAAFPDTLSGFAENVHPEDRARVLAAIKQCEAGGQRVASLYRYRNPQDGRERWIETSGRPIRGEDGRVESIVGVSADVSERKRAEEALRQSESRLRLALEAGRMSVWRMDQPSGEVAWSVLGETGVDRGWAPDTFPPSFQEFTRDVHQEDRDHVLDTVKRCQTRGEPIFVQYRYLRRRDGRVHWLETRAQATHGPDGRLEAITGLSLDITERKEQEAMLQARADQQRSVALLGQCALAGLNIDALLREAVGLLCETLGVDLGAVCEHQPEQGEFILRASHGFPEGWLGRCLANDEPDSGARWALQGPLVITDVFTETRFRTSPFLRELSVVSVAVVVIEGGDDGRSFGTLSVYSRRPRQFTEDDVTFLQAVANILATAIARHRAEEAVRQARAEAERANAAKSEFLSRMSHELRTPLNAILGFGQLLEIGDLPAQHTESVGYILSAGRHLLALIDEVLDIARIESGHLTVHLESVAVGELLVETLCLLGPFAAERGIRLPPSAQHPANGDCRVLADRQHLKQILLNLLSNAIKFNRAHGEVRTAFQPVLDAKGDRLRLEVSDTGAGLSEAQLARLFTPFERLGAERTGVEGTGIGLVLSRRLAESMGGTIQVESRPGVGSTFSVELPLAESLVGLSRGLTDDTGTCRPPLLPDLDAVGVEVEPEGPGGTGR